MNIVKWIWKYIKRVGCAMLNRKCCPECVCKV
jgi:chromatin remodeling complex protein RSC6